MYNANTLTSLVSSLNQVQLNLMYFYYSSDVFDYQKWDELVDPESLCL